METIQHYVTRLISPFVYVVMSWQRIYWLYLLTSLLIACGVFAFSINRGKRFNLKTFLKYVFPKKTYLHRSAVNDYVFFILNRGLYFLVVLPLLLSSSKVSEGFSVYLSQTFGAISLEALHPYLLSFLLTLGVFFAIDFGIFITHFLQHKIPLLWQFHKVHHSAEVLTPITVYRMHPLDDIFTISTVAAFAGLVEGGFHYCFPKGVFIIKVLHLNLFTFLFYFLGYNLRHSHVWLTYSPKVSRIFISPAQHQVHHSNLPKHYDKNFGFVFAFWDLIFGSLYIPKAKEKIQYGLSHGEEKEFSSPLQLFFLPFYKAFRLISSPLKKQN